MSEHYSPLEPHEGEAVETQSGWPYAFERLCVSLLTRATEEA